MVSMKLVTPEEVRANMLIDPRTLYLDFTASGLGYAPIEQRVQDVLRTYANTHSEIGTHAVATSEAYTQARASLRASLQLTGDDVLLPVGTGVTGAIKKFQEIIGIYLPPKTKERFGFSAPTGKPLVIVGPYEHHSNEVSFREALCDVVRVPRDTTGACDIAALDTILATHKGRDIIGSFSAASNVTGVCSLLAEIGAKIRAQGGVMCVDAATYSAHGNVSSAVYDALFLSPHKLIGGPGSCGLLVVKKHVYDGTLPPTFGGGGTVAYVSRTDHTYLDDIEAREDAGTPGILQLIRAAEAYALRNAVGLEVIREREEALRTYAYTRFGSLSEVTLYSSRTLHSVPIFSFNVGGVSPYVIAEMLSRDYGIQTRAGCSCAGPYGHDLLGLRDGEVTDEKPGWVRIGFTYIHTKEDIDYFFSSLTRVIETCSRGK
jgi:selenocysteine lyase/cysteine desulfurase